MPQPIQISLSDDPSDDRFARFGLIQWWDQTRLARAKVLVAGAGALGNEIVKNLALLGIGNVLIADMDRVENSNLSRSVLFRASDNGRPKAEVAATMARDIFPKINAQPFVGNLVYDLGLGAFAWADVVIGGLDNREARLAINRACRKVGKPWVDGAIEAIQGVARVFSADSGPCYECTMTKTDWQLLQNRRSCNLLSRSQMEQGKTPTTPTIASIIAGVQCQEAVKLLHGMDTIAGRGWTFNGISGDSYLVEYQAKEDCLSHEKIDKLITIDAGTTDVTAGDLLAEAQQILGPDATLELARDVLKSLDCPNCGESESVYVSLGKVQAGRAYCPKCTDVRRDVRTFYRIDSQSDVLDRPLAEIGVPPWDIVMARAAGGNGPLVGFELAGDQENVFNSESPRK